MRSNLLSLKNIATQMDKTQLILATGKKVNSAIDNASSYYQARSLTNRAADLTALLDSMGQGIQTIEAATQGIEHATSILEQMQSITNQAGTLIKIPSKEEVENKVGANGAVVTTAQELYDAINSGKETICVYGNIDLGKIDTAGKEITLKAGQKLVGVGYFGYSDSEVDKFSSITASATTAKNMINITQDGCLVSDLSINYTNTVTNGPIFAINVVGVKTSINNLNLAISYSDDSINLSGRSAIHLINAANLDIKGNININISGNRGYGIYAYGNSVCNIISEASVNIQTFGMDGFAVLSNTASIINFDIGSEIKLKTNGQDAFGFYTYENANYNVMGNLYIETNSSGGIFLSPVSNNTVNILSSAQIYFNTSSSAIINSNNGGQGNNILNIAAGAKLAFEKDGTTKWYQVGEDYKDENTSTSQVNTITADNIATTIQGIADTSAWALPDEIADDEDTVKTNVEACQNQFNTALKEYDKLLSDCSYQGINLLKGGNLKLTFDENRQHVFNVLGQDITSKALNINEALWQTQGDINRAIDELNASITTLRSLAENLGNQYSVITTRINFTEALTDVLETGADDLTLADMNEASAQYLSLETRQQLAINSLSLASMSARSILSLFY